MSDSAAECSNEPAAPSKRQLKRLKKQRAAAQRILSENITDDLLDRVMKLLSEPKPSFALRTERLIQKVIEREGGLRCYLCGRENPKEFVLDHVIPRSRGGSDGISNRNVACRDCDKRKGSRLPSECDWSITREP